MSTIDEPFVPVWMHTAGVVVVNVTASPDDDVAATATGEASIVFAVWAGKVTVWVTLETAKLRTTVGAGAQVAFPAWSALTEHVPGPRRMIDEPFVPLVAHTPDEVVEKTTPRPDVAVADTATGDWFIFFAPGAVNLTVWDFRTSRLAVAVSVPTVAVTTLIPTVDAEHVLAAQLPVGLMVNVAAPV